jgi:hypothetical protein
METLWGSKITRSQLQQSISNLQQLDKLPEIPRENLVNLDIDPTHQLSVVQEREIASNLAFLSATSDDSLKVMAICVEEHRNGKGITIRVASNMGDCDSSSCDRVSDQSDDVRSSVRVASHRLLQRQWQWSWNVMECGQRNRIVCI